MHPFREEDGAGNIADGMVVHEDLRTLVTDKGDASFGGRRDSHDRERFVARIGHLLRSGGRFYCCFFS